MNYLRVTKRGFLATVGPSGKPTVIPICFVFWRGEIFTAIDNKPKTTSDLARVTNIRKRPDVTFIADNYTDDWEELSYLLIHGRGRILKGRSQRSIVKTLLISKYPQYRKIGLDGSTILAIKVIRSKLWRFSSSKART